MEKDSTLNLQLAAKLRAAKSHQAHLDTLRNAEEKVHVIGAGATITAGYEQLRNAAEHAEENVLLQRAIRRFYRRLFLPRDRNLVASSGDELITELTLAGYLPNDTIPRSYIDKIGKAAAEYFDVYMSLDWRNKHRDRWTLDVLSVEIEDMFNSYAKQDAFIEFSYSYFLDYFKEAGDKKIENHDVAVFIATHKALLKTDPARIRWILLRRYQQTPKDFGSYTKTNELIDSLMEDDETDRLFRVINRQGATFRILWQMVEAEEDLDTQLASRDKFLSAYEAQIETTYTAVGKKIRKGIIKSVIFLFITKTLIGLLIEVPYDILIHGSIIWLPLVINLFFPPLYMILLSNTLLLPGRANTEALIDKVEALLYGTSDKAVISRRRSGTYGWPYRIAYALFILAVVGSAIWGLYSLGFSPLHLGIFLIFLSTASFLGFSLSRLVREVEAIDGYQGGVTMIRDFLYMPFVIIGRWISEKYAKINLVAQILDMVIELPLKTILRLIRQWGAFISSKKDEL